MRKNLLSCIFIFSCILLSSCSSGEVSVSSPRDIYSEIFEEVSKEIYKEASDLNKIEQLENDEEEKTERYIEPMPMPTVEPIEKDKPNRPQKPNFQKPRPTKKPKTKEKEEVEKHLFQFPYDEVLVREDFVTSGNGNLNNIWLTPSSGFLTERENDIFANAVTYKLDGNGVSLSGILNPPTRTSDLGEVKIRYRFLGDGRNLFQMVEMTAYSIPVPFEINLKDIDILNIEVEVLFNHTNRFPSGYRGIENATLTILQ